MFSLRSTLWQPISSPPRIAVGPKIHLFLTGIAIDQNEANPARPNVPQRASMHPGAPSFAMNNQNEATEPADCPLPTLLLRALASS